MSSYFSEGKREDYIRTNSRYEAGWSDPRECRAGPLVSWRPNYHPSTSPPVIDHYIHRILFSSLDYPLFSLRAHQKYVHLLLRWHGDAFYGVFLLFR